MADFDPNELPQSQSKPAPQLKLKTQKAKKPEAVIPPPPQYLLDTLNETVCETITRDLKNIMQRTYQVVWIFNKPSNPEVYEQWDVFGPAFYSLLISFLSFFAYIANSTTKSLSSGIIPVIICVIFIIGFVLALNMSCIGAKVNIMGTIAMLGYCLAPITIEAIVVLVFASVDRTNWQWLATLIALLVAGACCFWCLFITYGFYRNIVAKGKVFIGVYPVFLYYIIICFMVAIPALFKNVTPVPPQP